MDETTQKSPKKKSLVSLSHQRFLASFLLPPKKKHQQQQPQSTEWKHPLLRSSQEHEESRRQRYRQQRQDKISIQQQLLEEKLQRLRSKRISLAAEIAEVGSKLDSNNNRKRSTDPSNLLANDDTTIRRSSNFVASLQKVRNKRKLTAAARLGGITAGIPVDDPEVLSIRFDICVDGAYVASYHVFFHLILLVDPSMATSNEKKEHGNITKAETTTTQTKKTGQEERRDGEFEEQNDSDSSDQETTKQSPPTEGNARKKPKLTTHANKKGGTDRKGDSERESDSDNDDDDSDRSKEENPKQPSSREAKRGKRHNTIRKKRRLKPIQLKKGRRKHDSDSDYQDESERPKPKSRAKAKRTSRPKREIDESDSDYQDESDKETPQQETTTHENKNLPQLCLRLTQHTIPSAIPLADIAMATLGGTLFGLGDFDGGEWTSNAGVMKMLQERLGRFGRQCYRACSAWEQRKHSWELLMQKGQQQPCRCNADDCHGHVKVASVTTPASNALHQVSFQLSKTWCKQGDTSVSSPSCYNVALLYDDWLRGIPSHVQVDRSSPPTATIPPRQNDPSECDEHVMDTIRKAFLECPVERALSRLEQQWDQGNARQRSN